MLVLSQLIASDLFISIYVLGLIGLTAVWTKGAWDWVREEQSAQGDLQKVLEGSAEPSERLRTLIKLTDARINTNAGFAAVASDAAQEKRAAERSILSVTGLLLGAIAATPTGRHVQEGLRPSRDFLWNRMHRQSPKMAAFGENIIFIGLLGTFLGIVAALTIASAKLIPAPGTTLDLPTISKSLQALLTTASAKFWISAVAIGCALILRLQQTLLDKAVRHITFELSRTIDLELNKPEIANAWSVGVDTNLDPIAKMLADVAHQLRGSAASWTRLMPEFVEAIAQATRDASRHVQVQVDRAVLEDFAAEQNEMIRQAGQEAASLLGGNEVRSAAAALHAIGSRLDEISRDGHAQLDTLDRIRELLERLPPHEGAADLSSSTSDAVASQILDRLEKLLVAVDRRRARREGRSQPVAVAE